MKYLSVFSDWCQSTADHSVPSSPSRWCLETQRQHLQTRDAQRAAAVRPRSAELVGFELSANAGRVVTHEQLLRRVWGLEAGDDVRPMRTAINSIRRKLRDDAASPTCIFTEARVGYRMARPEPPATGENRRAETS